MQLRESWLKGFPRARDAREGQEDFRLRRCQLRGPCHTKDAAEIISGKCKESTGMRTVKTGRRSK